ncbi:hypothetical protein HKI87_16g83150 [Chloropicon roscoffensis]|uniref:Uncharacterized protein n=1 Tax=Chloropicon roscoffensis TaxID=1461544 RepID=A0AAX4PKB0_9CHLO
MATEEDTMVVEVVLDCQEEAGSPSSTTKGAVRVRLQPSPGPRSRSSTPTRRDQDVALVAEKGTSGRSASPSASSPSSSSVSEIEAFKAEIVDGLEEELSASRARYLELEYKLEKSEEAKQEKEDQILSLTGELARLRESYVALEQKMVGMQSKRDAGGRPRTPTKAKGPGSAEVEERDSLSRQLSKATRALDQERRLTSQLSREVREQAEKLVAMEAMASTTTEVDGLRAEVEALRSQIERGEEKTSLVKRTLDDSNAQCLAASSTIDKLITENVEYIERINDLGGRLRTVAEKQAAAAAEAAEARPVEEGLPESSAGAVTEAPAVVHVPDLESAIEPPLAAESEPPRRTGFFGFITGADLVA